MRGYTEMGRRVWSMELKNFFFRDRRSTKGPTLETFWGKPQDAEERSMVLRSGSFADPRPAPKDPLRTRPLLTASVAASSPAPSAP